MKIRVIIPVLYFIAFSCTKPQEKLPDNVFYTCSMDPQVMEKKPGKCPVCKMELTRITVDPHQQGIKLSEEQIALAHIKTAKVQRGKIGVEKVLSATIVENENRKSSISARFAGRIEHLYFKNPGEKIREGEVLYEIYSEELLAAENNYINALEQQKQTGNAAIDYGSIVAAAKNKLLLWGLTAKQMEKLKNEKQPGNTLSVISRRKGVITSVEAREGDYVTEGATLFELADFSTVWAEAQLYPAEAANISTGQQVKVRITAFPGTDISGEVSFINPQLQAQSKISLARIEISNPEGLYKPGMQAYVNLVEDKHEALYIDANAVLVDANGATVWIRKSDGIFESKMVQVGIRSNNQIEIMNGLAEGDEVVISGAYLINSEYIFKKGANPAAANDMNKM